MKKVILATSNQGKIKEFSSMLTPLHIEVLSNKELDQGLIPQVVEDGTTFEENALKKANAYFDQFHIPALADDSGLEVEALNGAPGIFSARYAGPDHDDRSNYEKLLQDMQAVPFNERKARFTCVIAYVDGKHEPLLAKGHCEGYILDSPRGEGGFGYDPVFYVPSYDQTMAELPKDIKNRISHRFHALQNFLNQWKQLNIDS